MPQPAAGAGRPRDRPRRRRTRGFVAGLPAGPLGRPLRQPHLPADLGRRSRARPGRRAALRRRAGQPADAVRLALVLPRGVRRDGVSFQSQLTSLSPRASSTASRPCGSRCSSAGFAWLPAFMWRFDKEWRGLRREMPWATRPPSEYMREHVRLTLQPFDGPPDAAELLARDRPARLRRAADVRDRLPALALRHAGEACRPACRRRWPRRSWPRTRARSTGSRERRRDLRRPACVATAARQASWRRRLRHRTAWPTRRRRSTANHLSRADCVAGLACPRATLGDRAYLSGLDYPRPTPRAARTDAWPPSGGRPAPTSLPARAAARRLGHRVRRPDCRCSAPASSSTSSSARRFASAINDWQVAEWLEPEPRLRASIVVPTRTRELAAREIERLRRRPALRPGPVLSRTAEPLGRRKYWPIYEAAAEHGLPVGIHFGGWGGGPITGAGWPSYYLEDHAGWRQPSRTRSSASSSRASSSASRPCKSC